MLTNGKHVGSTYPTQDCSNVTLIMHKESGHSYPTQNTFLTSTHILMYTLPPPVSNVYSKTTYVLSTCIHYVYAYLHTSLPFLLGLGLSWWHSCHLPHWQQSTTSPLSTRTCWQTTDTTPSMCGRTSSSTWPQWWCGWW